MKFSYRTGHATAARFRTRTTMRSTLLLILILIPVSVLALTACGSSPAQPAQFTPSSAAQTETTTTSAATTTQAATTAPAPASTTAPAYEADDYGMPQKLHELGWTCMIPDYAGTGRDFQAYIHLYDEGVVSFDITPADDTGAVLRAIQYVGEYEKTAENSVTFSLQLVFYDMARLPEAIFPPRESFECVYRFAFEDDGPQARFTLTDPADQRLFTDIEDSRPVTVFEQLVDGGGSFPNFQTIRNYMLGFPQVAEQVQNGMSFLIDPEPEVIVRDSQDWRGYHVALGTNHDDHFVQEIHYYLMTSGELLLYDPVTDSYETVGY